ncbi:DJ-1 family protein [Helicobacter jaachi]|uniref:DJ-1 family protein n=1 Tax=Helicobacter jaachi TaxID=1677920 RepID=A0A4U8TA65_9HELI|nr:DJ-1 family glyoxalase III [Helicobacter jaachi]TLD96573.1 DJ-1 family protein [Helicobacter jaachi]
MKSVLVPLAKGFEEIELISVVDILRRANVRVVMASLDSHKRVLGAHHIIIEANATLGELDMAEFSAVVLAGGYEGMQNLAKNDLVTSWLQAFRANNKLLCAICAAPIVLDKAGVLPREFTCYPGCEAEINMQDKHKLTQAVVTHDNIITSTAPATAAVFALEIVEHLCGKERTKALYEELQMPTLKDYLHTAAY